jgi:hypothetical protein
MCCSEGTIVRGSFNDFESDKYQEFFFFDYDCDDSNGTDVEIVLNLMITMTTSGSFTRLLRSL